MGQCDPACQKIIINTGLVAHFAELYAAQPGIGPSLKIAASELAAVARAATGVYDVLRNAGVIEWPALPDWNGCEHAAALTAWLEEPHVATAEQKIVMMRGWTSEILADVRSRVGSNGSAGGGKRRSPRP